MEQKKSGTPSSALFFLLVIFPRILLFHSGLCVPLDVLASMERNVVAVVSRSGNAAIMTEK